MRPLTVDDLRCGARVLYVGPASGTDIADSGLIDSGRILMERHPGLITRVTPERLVFIRFVGLECQQVCEAGFTPDPEGRYPSLVCVTTEEWVSAMSQGWWAALAEEPSHVTPVAR
jgi:hypothetical protein